MCIVEISRMTENRSLWLLNKQAEDQLLSQRALQHEEQRSYYSPDYTALDMKFRQTSPKAAQEEPENRCRQCAFLPITMAVLSP